MNQVDNTNEVNSRKKEKIKKAECFECGGERNCRIRGRYTQHGGDGVDFQWTTDWYILQCRGCDTVFAQTVSTNSEDYDHYDAYDGNFETVYKETIEYWPAQANRSYPEWMTEAGIDAEDVEKLDEALIELYKALNNDLNILAGIGIRTSFDVASNLLGVEEDLPFQKKIEALLKDGKIGPQDRERIGLIVEAGNASAHRGWKPSTENLNTLMSILEYFVHDNFVAPARKARMEAKVARVGKEVPRRRKKDKS